MESAGSTWIFYWLQVRPHPLRHALDPIDQMRLVYCLLNGPIEDAITGDESAEHGIANVQAGLLALIEDRGGNIDDIQP